MSLASRPIKTYKKQPFSSDFISVTKHLGPSSYFVSRKVNLRGRSRTVATSKMERFVILVNGFQPLTIITKRSILDVVVVLDPSLSPYQIISFNV